MRDYSGERAAAKLLSVTFANFSAISFGIGVFEKDPAGLIAGCYPLLLVILLCGG